MMDKIGEIVGFVFKHPETVASRRICREILGRAADRINLELAEELTTGLKQAGNTQVESYYSLIR